MGYALKVALERLQKKGEGFVVTIRVRWWIAPPRRADSLDARDSVLAAIKKKLQAATLSGETP